MAANTPKSLSPPIHPSQSPCAAHPYLERRLDDIAERMDNNFVRLFDKLDSVRDNTHEIVKTAVAEHAAACPIRDVTKTVVRGRKDSSDSIVPPPRRQARNMTRAAKAIGAVLAGIGAGIAAWFSSQP